jgi:ATP-dependent RNA helicase RhlE
LRSSFFPNERRGTDPVPPALPRSAGAMRTDLLRPFGARDRHEFNLQRGRSGTLRDFSPRSVIMSFDSLGLLPELRRALAQAGYAEATEVQQRAVPIALAGGDLLAGAQTGTGKTAAFALPTLQRLMQSRRGPALRHRVRALVLTPTRELAAQVHASVRKYGRELPLTSGVVFGGVGMQPQIDLLRRGVDVLLATPGRLIDHLDRRGVDLSGVEILVLDEADRMLDMGFLPALKKILASLPRQRQTLMFSATFADPIKALAQQFLNQPSEVQVAQRNSVAATIAHRVHPVASERKRELLLKLLREDATGQTLVFARTKHGSDKLVRYLEQNGIRCAAIHGNKSQNARTRALDDFKRGRIAVLVATDIAARGLDIAELPVVINHDLPMVAEDYVHRIGRTGRAGAQGRAISLVAQDEAHLLRDIQRLLQREIALEPVAGFELAKFDVAGARAPKQAPARGHRRHGKAPQPHAAARRKGGKEAGRRGGPQPKRHAR